MLNNVTLEITKKYLTFPVNPKRAVKKLCFFENGELIFDLDIALDNIAPTFTSYVLYEDTCGVLTDTHTTLK